MRPSAAIRVTDLDAGYGRGEAAAVAGLSGELAEGSLTAIVGPNGAGKTTLLKCLAGLLRPLRGRVERAGKAPLAYLPQLAEIDAAFPVSVRDLVLLGHWARAGAFGAIGPAARAAADRALATVGLDPALGRRAIGELSQGQLRRALFARLVVQDAGVILLDEPFAAVDARTTADLLAVVAGWHREGRTVAAVLHDLGQVRARFPDTLLLARRPVAWGPTPLALTAENLRRAWGVPDDAADDGGSDATADAA